MGILFLFSIILAPLSSCRQDAAPITKETIAINIATFTKVWGFLKYYHPAVAEHLVDWDEAFVNFYPKVKNAKSFDDLNDVMWSLYMLAENANTYTELEGTSYIDKGKQIADFSWIDDEKLLTKKLSKALNTIRVNGASSDNYYISPVYGVANPNVERDSMYYSSHYPDEPVRVLALARYWNIINYFYPYKDVIGSSWDSVLFTYILRVRETSDTLSYLLAAIEFTRKINDAHAFFENAVLAEYFGSCHIPVDIGYHEGKTVIMGGSTWSHNPDSLLSSTGFTRGDVILSINGKPVEERRKWLLNYVAGSNEASCDREVNKRLLRGKLSDTVTVVVDNGMMRRTVVTTYQPRDTSFTREEYMSDTPWKNVGGNICYVDMSKLRLKDVGTVMANILNSSGIVFDVRRGSNNTLYDVAGYLSAPKSFTYVTIPNYRFPGYILTGDTLSAGGVQRYRRKIAILVGEHTQSHAEFTTMALQVAPQAKTFGSQTAGADGNVSSVLLPGKIRAFFTGIGIFYPDGTPTQRVGIKIDQIVKPTVAGIRAGKDEILDAAIEYLKN